MKIIIDGIETTASPGETLLDVARGLGIRIPTLCYHEAFGGKGVCRLCMVEVIAGGSARLVASCTYPVTGEIEVRTTTPEIEQIRRNIIMLLHRRAPGSEFIQDLYREYGCPGSVPAADPDERCIMCRLCTNACETLGACAITAVSRGTDKRIDTPYGEASPDCIGCCACAEICPTKAIDVVRTADHYAIWNKEFDMERCAGCGRPFISRPYQAHISELVGQELSGEQLCPVCRKKQAGGVIADVHRNRS
ncbi:MAG: 2Fe-2S iron-sulfur cluster-binding protein [Thermacetogeniaceae bacterium]